VLVQLPPLPLPDLGSAANRCCDCLISHQSVSLPKASKPYEGMTAEAMSDTRTIFGCCSSSRKTPSLVKAAHSHGTIELQDPASRHVHATHGRRSRRVVELEQCECWTYKFITNNLQLSGATHRVALQCDSGSCPAYADALSV
jgi:hypothetical protein